MVTLDVQSSQSITRQVQEEMESQEALEVQEQHTFNQRILGSAPCRVEEVLPLPLTRVLVLPVDRVMMA